MSTALCSVATVPDDESGRIAQALRRRDPEAIEALVERYAHRLLRYLVHLTGERALAEDLFQETWLRVLERGTQYDPHRPFHPWLLGIARHLAVDLLRRTRPLSLEAVDEPAGGESWPGARDPQPSPFEALASRERQERLASVTAALPSPYREVLFLRFQEEMSLEEIARVPGLAVSTVKSRLYRGLRHLAARLGGEP